MCMWVVTSMCMIEDDTELDRNLGTTKFYEFNLVDLPLNQPDIRLVHTRLAPQKPSNGELHMGVDCCQGPSLSFSNTVYTKYTLRRCTL